MYCIHITSTPPSSYNSSHAIPTPQFMTSLIIIGTYTYRNLLSLFNVVPMFMCLRLTTWDWIAYHEEKYGCQEWEKSVAES